MVTEKFNQTLKCKKKNITTLKYSLIKILTPDTTNTTEYTMMLIHEKDIVGNYANIALIFEADYIC